MHCSLQFGTLRQCAAFMDCCIPDPPQKQSLSTPTSGCLKTSTLVITFWLKIQGDWQTTQPNDSSRWSSIKTLSPRLDQDAPTPWEAALQTLPLQVCIQNCSSKQLQQGVPRSHWKWRQRWWSPSGHNCWALSDFMIGYICFRIFAIQAIRVFVLVRFFSQFSCYNMKQEKKHKNSLYWCQVSCWKLMSTSGFRCGDPWFAILVGGLTSWGGCAPPPRICIVDPFVCDCFTPSISYITCKCIKQQKHGKRTSKAPLKLWDMNETQNKQNWENQTIPTDSSPNWVQLKMCKCIVVHAIL